jgi:hypothetical protein
VDWYFKAALGVAIIWGVARSLGAYGDAARDLDLNFLYGFLLTLGGWGALFYVIDRVARFLGWRRTSAADEAEPTPNSTTATSSQPTGGAEAPGAADAAPAAPKSELTRRTARRPRR